MNRWDFYYFLRKTPWDSGITPPEIVSLVEGGRIPPGRAIDLGCGTGTNVLYLQRHGFEATGVDISARAVAFARRKLKMASVRSNVFVANILDTAHFPAKGPFDFAMDIGVMHIFDAAGRDRYAATLERIMRPGGFHYTFGFKPGKVRRRSFLGMRGPYGISSDDVRQALEPYGFTLLEAHDAGITPEGVSRTGWYLSQKK